jgi:hypothetical protein
MNTIKVKAIVPQYNARQVTEKDLAGFTFNFEYDEGGQTTVAQFTINVNTNGDRAVVLRDISFENQYRMAVAKAGAWVLRDQLGRFFAVTDEVFKKCYAQA